MRHPKIAISCRVTYEAAYSDTRDALAVDWTHLCDEMGWLPILVPNCLRSPGEYLREIGIDGVILSGGNTMSSRSRPDSGDAPRREETESALLDFAIEAGVPLLGVCRGLQAINRHFGGDLTHGILGESGHVGRNHDVRLMSPSWIAMAGSERMRVNSFHDDGVLPDQVASGLIVTATSDDGTLVEGLTHPNRPIAAIQWHPERPSPSAPFDRKLLTSVFGTP